MRASAKGSATLGPPRRSARRAVRRRARIAAAIGRRLGLPVVGKSPEQAAEHFGGWFAHFVAIGLLASSARTRAELGWTPTQPGPLADLDRPYCFRT
ncbi:MAG: hypothetical protein ABSF49_07125 [Roseiarcus sp.]|uniref:hypothetical protein n=1 Tax=Roseiarcus sp. TaxID=1969460 RepID=UPI003C252062